MLFVKLTSDEISKLFWSKGLYVQNDIRVIIPISSKNKTNISASILLAAAETLNELMRLDIDEDTRFSGTLSLYNVPL